LEIPLSDNEFKPWFKMWAARWLGSPRVSSMTLSEQGIFVRMMCAQHIYGKLPRDPWSLSKLLGINFKSAVKWLRDHSELTVDSEQSQSELTPESQQGNSEFLLKNFAELQGKLRKTTADQVCRVEKSREEKKKKRVDVAPAARERQAEEQELDFDSPVSRPKPIPVPVAKEETPTPKPPAPAGDGSLVNAYLAHLGKQKHSSSAACTRALDGVTRDYWNTVLDKLVAAHGEAHVRNVMGYCFENPMYARGAKTTKTDKADWFAEKFDELTDHMHADAEFDSRRKQKAAAAKVPDSAPGYRRNPTGREFLKPSDL
jgi:hypothetical protein